MFKGGFAYYVGVLRRKLQARQSVVQGSNISVAAIHVSLVLKQGTLEPELQPSLVIVHADTMRALRQLSESIASSLITA